MRSKKLVAIVACLLPAVAAAQTAPPGSMRPGPGQPTYAPPGLPRSPAAPPGALGQLPTAPGSPGGRTARNGLRPAGAVPPAYKPPKETAADRADRLKLERDLHICTGC